ncbi:MAG: 2-C-methyl-D-erythritol 4-phosphate cytidylyltransferase [Planctomycetota bacterium]|nr:MAG: 2-C-methyl-D-erythritol 4-phosphate cytidylyltransferase [Planctomycetota bacterium]
MPNFAVIIAAAGRSSRFRDQHYKKPFAPLAGRAVWLHSAERFLNRRDVKQVLVTIAEEDREEFTRKFGANLAIMGVETCPGGKQRADSIQNALARVRAEVDFVAVHDAARPCIADKWIDQVFAAAEQVGAAILAVPVAATLKRAASRGVPAPVLPATAAPTGAASYFHIAETVDRGGLWEAQTPQVFRRDLLCQAYAARAGADATDDAQLVERLGAPVALVEGSPMNLKITTKDDLRLAEQILKVLPKPKPDGVSHPFANDDLWR